MPRAYSAQHSRDRGIDEETVLTTSPAHPHFNDVVDCFVEIVRDDKNDTLTLNFRRRGRPVDGQGFFCIARAEACVKADSLFRQLCQSTKKLKLFAVQSDSFHHTGVLECGYCTVVQSTGSARLRNIKPNVPYYVTIAVHGERWSKGVKVDSSINEGAVKDRLGDDIHPIVDKVVLRELREQSSKIRPAFHIQGRSPWGENIIPSVACAQHLAWQYYSFAAKFTTPQKESLSLSKDGHATTMERVIVIHGVTDPLCGMFVSFILSMSDAVVAFRKHLGVDVSVADKEHARGMPIGPQPTAGDILDAMSVLGSRVLHSTLSASWSLDWFDVLLLSCLDTNALRRVSQVARQFKYFDVEGQPLSQRITWMLRPEKRPPPAGNLMNLLVSEAIRLRLEPEATSGHYLPSPLSPARALWCCMSHRQQVRAMMYIVPITVLSDEVAAAKKLMLVNSVIQTLYRSVRRHNLRRRLETWIQFVFRCRQRRLILRERQQSRASIDTSPLIKFLSEKTSGNLLTIYFVHWLRFRVVKKFAVPLLKKVEGSLQLRKFRAWRLFIMRQYNSRIPRSMTISACGDAGLLPMPPSWIKKVKSFTPDGERRAWTVFVGLGSKTKNYMIALAPVHSRQAGVIRPQRKGQETSRLDMCGCQSNVAVGPKMDLLVLIDDVSRFRTTFHYYRMWLRFTEISRSFQAQQQRQRNALHGIMNSKQKGHQDELKDIRRELAASMQLKSLLHSWFLRWVRNTEATLHQRSIVK